MKKPALKTLYTTADIGHMAVARRDGSIYWGEQVGDKVGILLFDTRQAAAEYAHSRWGYPFVIAEFGRHCVEIDLMERVANAVPHYSGDYRAWIYPDRIDFDTVRWHTYKEVTEVAPALQEVRIEYLNNEPVEESLPQGMIVIAQS